jgi:hypothetical protein
MKTPSNNLITRLTERLFRREISRQVSLAMAAYDDTRDRSLRPLFSTLPMSTPATV